LIFLLAYYVKHGVAHKKKSLENINKEKLILTASTAFKCSYGGQVAVRLVNAWQTL
jgi:hypothetical protein